MLNYITDMFEGSGMEFSSNLGRQTTAAPVKQGSNLPEMFPTYR